MNKNISDQLVEILVEVDIQRIYAVTVDSLNQEAGILVVPSGLEPELF